MLDELRGLAIIAMVAYHVFYSAAFLFFMDWGISAYKATTPFEPLIAITFISISGVCCSLSRNNLKRGVRLLLVACAVTLVTVFFTPGNEIYFGVLHFLSLAMIIYALLEKAISRIPPLVGAVICLILYLLLWGVPRGYLGFEPFKICSLPSALYSSDLFAFLGFPSATFFSADYFPLIPHLFLFLCGCFLGRLGVKKGFPNFLRPLRIRPLAFLGRHSLLIYVVHQPVIVAVLYIVSLIM
ncbi:MULTISPECIES: heparan-alpha-glucosaminide N-acetyltransferase [unclassified Ruminococcus]|uniref:heparan-alpha-glucosaminide N-acetyltransferase n=1 Tax=unclassified Ruminococcus TaxID=2608920 RepID=UPI00210DE174|nr:MULTISPECIES: heparan-alpha-glucosaminide N-acetyltransferase [unclassified Ruminococcus]MCQ4021891.1 DUF1624 domain-containing protein [Ruminococcus sp. zg-924]MCQ4114336.1 DUF1624 domain-containing protein [Ruminococcus sp. zg-921]